MNTSKYWGKTFYLLFLLFIYKNNFAQAPIVVGGTPTVADIQNLLFGPDVKVSNLVVNCPGVAYGIFTATGSNIGLTGGLLLTTGRASIAPSPNNSGSAGFDNNAPGNLCLQNYIGGTGGTPCVVGGSCTQAGCNSTSTTNGVCTCTGCQGSGSVSYDGCALEFDIIPTCDSLKINYVFGSDEYPEFVNSNVSDAFAFFISGPGITGGACNNSMNMATIPGTGTLVSIDNLNATTNSQYYISNNPLVGGTQYDAFTKVMTAKAKVTPCQTYHLNIVIADFGDGIYDSGVFLEKGGISCGAPSVTVTATNAVECCSNGSFTFTLSQAPTSPLTIYYTVGGTATSGSDYTAPGGSVTIPAGQTAVTIPVSVLCDGITEGSETITLSVGQAVCAGVLTGGATIIISDATPLTVSSATICAGTPTSLTASGGNGSYSWSTGATTSSISVSPTTTTNYTVTSGTGTCTISATTSVIVGTGSASITPPSTICPGQSTTLVAGGGGTYSWSPGGATTPSIVVSPGSTSTYTVNVVNGLCTAMGTTTVTVSTTTTSVSPPVTICQGSSASLTASGGTSYSWTPGGSTSPSINVSPSATASYTVVVSNGSCLDTATTTVTVNSVSPTITPPVTICAGDVATITASGGGSYAWTPGGSTTPSISVTPTVTTTYSVTVSNGGCSSTLIQTISVNAFVAASIAPPPAVCLGSSITLIASGGNNYSWSNGTNSPTIIVTPSVGTTSYSVIVSSGTSCIDTAYTSVTVNPLPTPAITAPVTICLGTLVTHTASGGTNYSWSNGSVTSSIAVSPTVSTTYSVLVTDVNGCTGTASTDITVNPFPAPTVSSATICAGASATLTATGGNTYTWSNGQTGPTLVVSPGTTTTYTVTVSSTNGCNGSAFGSVAVVLSPTAVFSNSAPCEGSSVSFTDGSLPAQGDPIISWNWSLPGGSPTSSGVQHPVIYYPTAGTYTASLTIASQTGCIDTVAQTVIIYAKPIALFAGNDSACSSVCHTFMDNSQAVNGSITSWYWTFPGGNPSSSTSQNPTICYSSPGNYGASLTVTTNYGCTNTFGLNPVISVYSVPTADFCVAPTQASITDPTFKFCDLWTSDVSQWFWAFGDGDSDRVNTDPSHSYSAGITYNDFYTFTVCLNVQTIHGCWDSICKNVDLLPEFTFYIPNTFSPNGDGINEFFFGKGRGIKEYDVCVFDRWGNIIWDCHYEGNNTEWDVKMMDGMSSACKWDGKVEAGGADMSGRSGNLAQEDVYVWKVKLKDIFEKQHTYVGHVSVIR